MRLTGASKFVLWTRKWSYLTMNNAGSKEEYVKAQEPFTNMSVNKKHGLQFSQKPWDQPLEQIQHCLLRSCPWGCFTHFSLKRDGLSVQCHCFVSKVSPVLDSFLPAESDIAVFPIVGGSCFYTTNNFSGKYPYFMAKH